LGAILASLGVGGSDAAGGGVVTGSGVGGNTGYTIGADGQIVYNGGTGGSTGPSAADLQAQSEYYANAAAYAQQRDSVHQTNLAIIQNANSQLQVSNATLANSGYNSSGAFNGGFTGAGNGQGVFFPGSGGSSVVQGGVQLSVNAGLTAGGTTVPYQNTNFINNSSGSTQFNPNVPPSLSNTLPSNNIVPL
jgi:hypothetical protein